MPQTPGGPSDELVRRLYDAKYPLQKLTAEMSLPEKFKRLLKLQKIAYAIRVARGDQLQSWEKPWDVDP
jgi:hypothetical protein